MKPANVVAQRNLGQVYYEQGDLPKAQKAYQAAIEADPSAGKAIVELGLINWELKLPLRIFPGAPSNALTIEASGDIGLGTTGPDAELDIEGSGPGLRLTNTGTGAGFWDVFSNANNGRLNFEINDGNIPLKIDDGADTNLLQIGIVANDQVDITGNLMVSGSITPDYVFEPGYYLESIEEHADYMWTNKHLPAVGAATLRSDGSHAVNVGVRSQSMLEELEKAHIYIEQLNATIVDLQERLEKLEIGANE